MFDKNDEMAMQMFDKKDGEQCDFPCLFFDFSKYSFKSKMSLPRHGLNARRVGRQTLPAGRPGSQRLPRGPTKAPAPLYRQFKGGLMELKCLWGSKSSYGD